MRVLVQRVSEASVTVEGEVLGGISGGLVVLVCAMRRDTPNDADKLATRVAKLRIFRDDQGRMNRSLLDAGGGALVISQFTLAADLRSGNRPGFSTAAAPEDGLALYERFANALREHGVKVETGRFGAEMQVSLVNDGPVTIWIDSSDRA